MFLELVGYNHHSVYLAYLSAILHHFVYLAYLLELLHVYQQYCSSLHSGINTIYDTEALILSRTFIRKKTLKTYAPPQTLCHLSCVKHLQDAIDI